MASATIGAGETVLAVRVGAWGGYDLLWLILLAVVTKSFLTLYLLGRYAAVSGRAAAETLVELPGPRGWFLWLMLVLEAVVAPFVFVVIAAPCGQLMSQILAGLGWTVSYKLLAIVFVSLAIIVGMIQQYETLEKSQIAVCLILVGGTVGATALVWPDLTQVLKGLVRAGYIPEYPDWIPAEIKNRSRLLEMSSVFGYAGSIGLNYLVYANWVLIKKWTVGEKSLGQGLKALQWDVGFNAVVVLLVTSAFMVAGAAILNPLHRIPAGFDLLTEQAYIFGRISRAMIPLYYITILAALWGTMNSLPDIYARGAHSFLEQLLPRARLSFRTVMNVFGVVTLPLCWYLIWRGTTPVVMIDLVALFSTNVSVGLACWAGVWLDRRLPRQRRAPAWLWWAAVAAAVVITFMSALSAREVLGKYINH